MYYSYPSCPFCGGKPRQKTRRAGNRIGCSNKACKIYKCSFTLQEWISRAGNTTDTFDYLRLRNWAESKPRKPANTAFTQGIERNIAYLIEDISKDIPKG